MHYSNVLAAMGVATLITSAIAGPIEARAVTAAEVVTNFGNITTLSINLQGPAQSISILDFFAAIVRTGNVYVR